MAESMEMPFRGLTWVGPRNHVLDGVQMPQKRAILDSCPAHWKALGVCSSVQREGSFDAQ